MEAPSQVILRNRERLGEGPLLLADMPADGLARTLQDTGLAVRASTPDRGAFRTLTAQAVDAAFECVPQVRTEEELVVLRLSREKERFAMVLHALAASMGADARLWVVGEKRAGINSAARLLEQRFSSVTRVDSARHCGLYEATAPRATDPFELDDYATTFRVDSGLAELTLYSLPGVFAHRRVDEGTALLLESLAGCTVEGDVLDFACGNGIVGISLLRGRAGLSMTLLDASALAVEATRRSLALNHCDGAIVASDGLSELEGAFDWIVSNPPFHRGVVDDLDIAADFFRRAGTFLRADGKIVVVFNRHLPYERWARDRFRLVNRLSQNRTYTVIQASKPV